MIGHELWQMGEKKDKKRCIAKVLVSVGITAGVLR